MHNALHYMSSLKHCYDFVYLVKTPKQYHLYFLLRLYTDVTDTYLIYCVVNNLILFHLTSKIRIDYTSSKSNISPYRGREIASRKF